MRAIVLLLATLLAERRPLSLNVEAGDAKLWSILDAAL